MIRPPKPLVGTDSFSQWCNQLLRFVTSRRLVSTPTIRIEEGPFGIAPHAKGGGGGGPSTPSSTTRPFQFVQSWGDYVIGKDMVYGTLTPVAKPFKHRNSNTTEWENGQAFQLTYPQNVKVGSPPTWNTLAFISRTKSGGGYTELQRITPGWTAEKNGTKQVADIFYASQLTQGGTGVRTDPQDTSFPPGTPVVWLDDNRDGRAWGATPDGNP